MSTEEIQNTVEQLQKGAVEARESMSNGQKKAVLCVEKSKQAGQTLASITSSISSIRDMNEQITTSTKEQSQVTADMQQNIVEFADTTSQISADTSCCADTSKQLSELADELHSLVKNFCLK